LIPRRRLPTSSLRTMLESDRHVVPFLGDDETNSGTMRCQSGSTSPVWVERFRHTTNQFAVRRSSMSSEGGPCRHTRPSGPRAEAAWRRYRTLRPPARLTSACKNWRDRNAEIARGTDARTQWVVSSSAIREKSSSGHTASPAAPSARAIADRAWRSVPSEAP
jgi:hypothetical protein